MSVDGESVPPCSGVCRFGSRVIKRVELSSNSLVPVQACGRSQGGRNAVEVSERALGERRAPYHFDKETAAPAALTFDALLRCLLVRLSLVAMASFLRGKQSGIQGDLSQGITQDTVQLDDVSEHPYCRHVARPDIE